MGMVVISSSLAVGGIGNYLNELNSLKNVSDYKVNYNNFKSQLGGCSFTRFKV